MSFGGGGGGFSFGSNNTSNTNTGFGGFGSSSNANTNNTGFGSNTGTTGFGSSTTAANPFGGSTFGSSNTGGFGSNNNNNNSSSTSLFGSKPANPFGSNTSSGGGLFGSTNNASSGFGTSTGGFGSNSSGFGTNTNNTGSGFSFGATTKPAFGSSTTTAPLFGQGGAGTTGGFGATSSGFGTGSGTALNAPVGPSEGTASVPYQSTQDKDGPGTSNYMSINFMPAYSKYSFEELRMGDYNAGRRFGNATGTAGGFGTTNFGGFGSSNTTTTAFGSNTNTSSNPFGAASSSSGFGSNTATTGFGGGGLFGNKPATGGGLFGQQSSSTTSGGLFGTTGSTTGGFGSNTNTGGAFGSSSTGGGLFGNTNNNNQNQNQNKPAFGSGTGSGFSFGNNSNNSTTTGGGLFGNTNTNSTPFGSNNQQSSGGLFGNNNNTQQKSLFGNTGGFGTSTTQNQPSGGLFGTSNTTSTGGGLFGNTNNNTNTTSGGLFGNTNNTNTGGSLFGNNNANNQQKPGGLFGGSTFGNTNTTNTGGGLFGNTGATNQQSGGLFGNTNANTGNNSLGLFGNSQNKPPGTSLFGNSTNNQAGGLFGNSQNNSGSLFGGSQNQQNNQQQSEFKHSSLMDPNPYGQSSIWTGLPMPTPENSKPVFTPLQATQKLKESQTRPPPTLRLNQSRYMTPPRRSGFGFSYSTYGTPNSAASTPGTGSLSGSMYGSRSFNGGSFGRSFGKSTSMSNLRSQFNGDGESVLSPNAFLPSAHTRWSGGNMRRLTIDRSIRSDLFSRPSLPALPPPSTNGVEKAVNGVVEGVSPYSSQQAPEQPAKLRKRVSFDKDTTGGQNGTLNGETGAIVRIDDDSEESDTAHGSAVNGSANLASEVEPSRNNELAVVPEDRESDNVVPKKTVKVQAKPDQTPGDYWSKPSKDEMAKMPRDQLKRFVNFQVGRQGCGYVTFNGPVDLTAIPYEDLFGKLVEIRVRQITVYPDSSIKPPVGKGLNVPSTLVIENSWPRARGQPSSDTSGPVFDRHITRLKRVPNTEFVKYQIDTGVWTFKVPHYTRYGLDYDDDDDEEEFESSPLPAPPDSVPQSLAVGGTVMEVDGDDSYEDDDEDDTFAFKQKTVPGGFGRRSAVDYDEDVPDAEDTAEYNDVSVVAEESDEDAANDLSLVGSFPAPVQPVEMQSPSKPILKPNAPGTPGKPLISLEGDWAEQLQRTISPRKQNRDALRQLQSKVLLDRTYEPLRPTTADGQQFRTSIDIMNSLFSKHEERMTKGRKAQAGPDFEFPYTKRAKTLDENAELSDADKLWHQSFKSHFNGTNQLIFKAAGMKAVEVGWTTDAVLSGHPSIVASSLRQKSAQPKADVQSILADTKVILKDGVPLIQHKAISFSKAREGLKGGEDADIYELAHVLFDEYDDEFSEGLSQEQQQDLKPRILKDRLTKYLSALIWRNNADRVNALSQTDAPTTALLHLTANNIAAACDALMSAKNYNLTMLISQLPSADDSFQRRIAEQLEAWRSQSILSEISEEIRALYAILAGETTTVEGKENVASEDRARTFRLSEKFELDWPQTFALTLWFGKKKNGEVHESIAEFAEKISTGQEQITPADAAGNEDPKWVLLKLFASRQKTTGVEKPVIPQGLSSLNRPWDSERTFHFHNILASSSAAPSVDHARADELSVDVAFEAAARGDLVSAVYALLHISNSQVRASMIRDLLDRHAASLPAPPHTTEDKSSEAGLWSTLTDLLKIPSSWLFAAKALHARASNDSFAELEYLIAADDFTAAHGTLKRRVAPRLVIDEDWEGLTAVLASFGTGPAAKARDWASGGGLYADFVSLVGSGAEGTHGSAKERNETLGRLHHRLRDLDASFAKGDVSDKERLEERVAVREMSRYVANLLEAEDADKKAILELPLTSDARLSHARALGVQYYHGLMGTVH